MRQKFSRLALPAVALIASLGFLGVATAYAATPTFSLVNEGNNSVELNVTGDANSSVSFYYNVASASGMQVTTLGSTNSSGSFTTTINSNSYNIIAGDEVYVVVDGQQSTEQVWPYENSSSGSPTLSQTNVTIGLGQSTSITSQNGGSVYMSTNSNPSIATVSTNGTQINITGEGLGSSLAAICYVGTSDDCTNLTVTVQSGSVSTLSFSQNNVSIGTGASEGITISGGSGNYLISGNSNTSIVSTSLSGTVLTLYGEETGTATVTVCDQANTGTCGPIYVTIGSSGSTSGSVSFGETNPAINVGQNLSVSLSGSASYYVSSNSNTGIATASVSGDTLSLYGESVGSDSVLVCASSGGCSTLNVTVDSSNSSSGQAVSFGVTNPTITVGQNVSVSLSGGSSYLISSNANVGIAQATVSNATLTLYGESTGTDSVTVCVTGGGCNPISVNVENSGTTTTTSSGTVVPNSTLLSEVQSLQSTITSMLTQLQSLETQLSTVESQVEAGSGNTITTTSAGSTTASSASTYDFTELLTVGSEDEQVTELQQRLTTLGFYDGPITGYFGVETQTAVEKYQTAHGISPVGYVGPSTRAELNAGD